MSKAQIHDPQASMLGVITAITLTLVYLAGLVGVIVSIKVAATVTGQHNGPDTYSYYRDNVRQGVEHHIINEHGLAWVGIGGLLATILVTGIIASILHYVRAKGPMVQSRAFVS